MAAYCRVYDSKSSAGSLPRTGISSATLRSVSSMGYLFTLCRLRTDKELHADAAEGSGILSRQSHHAS